MFLLLLHDTVRACDILDVLYHFLCFNYWITSVFMGNGGILEAASRNATAMKHFSHLVDYLGTHPKEIFGDMNGKRGAAEILTGISKQIDESFAVKFWYSAKLGVELLVKIFSEIGG